MAEKLTKVDVPNAEDNAATATVQASAGKIVKGKPGMVAIASLIPFPHNARTPQECRENGIRLAANIAAVGFDPSQPLTVSERKDGTIVVLRGNGRLTGILILESESPDVYAARFPKGKVPAIVLSGLTESDEVAINADHDDKLDRRALSPWGRFLQVFALVTVCKIVSRFAIAEAVGMWTVVTDAAGGKTRKLAASQAQILANLAQLPEYVRVAFSKSPMFGYAGTDANKQLKSADIAKLYKALKAEAASPAMIGASADKAGTSDEFRAVWAEVYGKDATTPRAPGASRADLETASKGTSSGIVRDCLLIGAGKLDMATTLPVLVGKAVQYEADSSLLGMIREHLGTADFAVLAEAARTSYAAKLAAKPEAVEVVQGNARVEAARETGVDTVPVTEAEAVTV